MEFIKKYKILIKLIVLFIVTVIITFGLKYYFKPILYMIFVTLLCSPIFTALTRLKLPKHISGIISIIFINIILVLIIITLGNSIYNLLVKIYLGNVVYIEKQLGRIYLAIMEKSKFILIQQAIDFIRNANVTTGAIGTGDEIFAYAIGNVSAFFFLVDKDKICSLFENILPKEIMAKSMIQKEIFKKMLLVQMNLIVISTIEIIIGFYILDVPSPFLLGMVCGILDLLPYMGTIIVFIPIIIYNIIVKDYFVAFGLVCLYILVQLIREILEAKFLSDKLNIHPLLIILSVYIGVKIFGFLGIIVGPMYGMLAKEIIYSRDKTT